MCKPLIIFAVCYCLICLSCKSRVSDEYVISNQIDTSGLNYDKLFLAADKYADSLSNKMGLSKDTVGKKGIEFYKEYRKNNIALVYISDLADTASSSLEATPAILQVKKENDNVHLVAGVGFFGGYAVDIKIKGSKYSGSFYEAAQDSMFKHDTADEKFIEEITVDAQAQKLYLSKVPHFNGNECFFGQYEATFKPYYEKDGGIIIRKMKVKVIFKSSI